MKRNYLKMVSLCSALALRLAAATLLGATSGQAAGEIDLAQTTEFFRAGDARDRWQLILDAQGAPIEAPDAAASPRRLQDRRVYYATIECTYNLNAALASDQASKYRVGNSRIKSYAHLMAFAGLGEVINGRPAASTLVPSASEITTAPQSAPAPDLAIETTSIAGRVVTTQAQPTVIWDSENGYFTAGADRWCNQGFFFRVNTTTRPSVQTLLLASSTNPKGSAFSKFLGATAALLNQIDIAIPTFQLNGLDDAGDNANFIKAFDDFFALFQSSMVVVQQPELVLGRTRIDAGLFRMDIDIYDRDHSLSGAPYQSDNRFLTGLVPFSSSWQMFLTEEARLKLSDTNDTGWQTHCETTRETLTRASGTGVGRNSFELDPVDAAFVMLAALRSGNLTTRQAAQCLGADLAAQSRHLTDTSLRDALFGEGNAAKRAHQRNIVETAISAEHFFSQQLVDLLQSSPRETAAQYTDHLATARTANVAQQALRAHTQANQQNIARLYRGLAIALHPALRDTPERRAAYLTAASAELAADAEISLGYDLLALLLAKTEGITAALVAAETQLADATRDEDQKPEIRERVENLRAQSARIAAFFASADPLATHSVLGGGLQDFLPMLETLDISALGCLVFNAHTLPSDAATALFGPTWPPQIPPHFVALGYGDDATPFLLLAGHLNSAGQVDRLSAGGLAALERTQIHGLLEAQGATRDCSQGILSRLAD